MNEQLQTALSELLDKANNGIDTGTSFLQAQLPDVIQQLLIWKMVASLLLFALGVAFFVGVLVYLHITTNLSKPGNGYKEAKSELEAARNAYLYSPTCTLDNWKARRDEYYAKQAKVDELKPDEFFSDPFFRFAPALVLFFLGVLSLDFSWLQIWLAPKVYLIEYAASLAK